MTNEESLSRAVRSKYAKAAVDVLQGARGGCCGTGDACDPVTANLYTEGETAALPDEAVRASLGCGNPTALAELHAGDIVLDLGSGGGLDVLLSARRVGPTGKVYGVDMTDEMLTLARANQRAAGVENVEFVKADIARIPLPDAAVDVIISNCVINLAGDKRRVLAEAFRVLRPGGRLAISDVVVQGDLPVAVRRSMELWVGCVAGALGVDEFNQVLGATGFVDIDIEPTRTYGFDEARVMLADAGLDADTLTGAVDGRVMAAFVRARKPV